MVMQGKSILLIITGGIAAYKSLDLIRRLRERGAMVNCILTKGGAEFVTPLSVSSLSGKQTYTDLFSLKDEVEMGHIRLSREADLIVVAPATADFMAKLVQGRGDDLASTALLAANKPVLLVPSMNAEMWAKTATQDNVRTLESRGFYRLGPDSGDLACGEVGDGRMAEVDAIVLWCGEFFAQKDLLKGLKAIVTSGPTREAIDPVRYISNRSSGKQGHAIATALAMAGADTYYISGPTELPPPANCTMIAVETAQQMHDAAQKLLPADIAVCTAAVSDWMMDSPGAEKIKKQKDQNELTLTLRQTPDILSMISNAGNSRPQLVIGFAAETENATANARKKLESKHCDWVIANDVGKNPAIMGGNDNQISIVTKSGTEDWDLMSKRQVAAQLVQRISKHVKLKRSS